jgi:hypothetical protein
VRNIVKRSLFAVAACALAFGVIAGASAPVVLAADTYQIRLVATPVDTTMPSFVTADGDLLPWTGTYKGISKMYLYDLISGTNKYLNPGPSGSYYNPAAEDGYVAFQGSPTGGYDEIYLYNSENGNFRLISSLGLDGDRNDWNARIQGGRVVWEKDTADPATGSGIYVYDIAGGDATMVLAGPEYRDPDIWENYVVCVKSVTSPAGPNATEIILYNLTTSETTVIANADKNNEHPRIDNGRVVWSAGDIWTPDNASTWSTTYQVCLYRISSGSTSVITGDAGGNLYPAIDGDIVAWQTWTPSAIKGYEISSGTTFEVSQGGDMARSPEVDGGRIAWWGSKGLYYAVPSTEATMFPDVPSGHHYLTAIEGVAGEGIMRGYGDGNFGPEDWIIRQQFAEMISLTMGYPVSESDTYDFTDQPPIVHLPQGLYPYHYIAHAALKGVLLGMGDGTFRPLYRETRAEAVSAIVLAGGDALEVPGGDFFGTLTHPARGQRKLCGERNLTVCWTTSSGPTATSPAGIQWVRHSGGDGSLLWNLLAKVPPAT